MSAIINHYCCEQPSDTSENIWRYYSLEKFICLMETQKLHFSRMDYLGDPFEGKIYQISIERYILSLPQNQELYRKNPKIIEMMIKSLGNCITRQSYSTYVSCWNFGKNESSALWRLYGKGKNSICIQARYCNLVDILNNETYIGKVQYENIDENEVFTQQSFSYFMRKRKSFEFENEIRAVIWKPMLGFIETKFEGDGLSQDEIISKWEESLVIDKSKYPQYFEQSIDLNKLIDAIYVNPECDDWFFEIVKKLVADRYNCKKPVLRSSLDTRNCRLF